MASLLIIGAGIVHQIPHDGLTIGRDPGRGAACDVCLLDQSVSGSHATLMLRRGTWYLLDHSSANGTYVDGVRVNQCALPGVCELRLGAVTLRFRPVSSGQA